MTTAELIDLCRCAVAFADKAAGEGIEIDGIAPEDFLMRYSVSTGFEDWDKIGQHVADRLAEQEAEIARCHERLEITRYYRFTDDGEEPEAVEVPMSERANMIDGIECRNETISLLDERIAELQAEIARLREALEEIASYDDGPMAGVAYTAKIALASDQKGEE